MGLFILGLVVLKLLVTIFVVLLVVKLGFFVFGAVRERIGQARSDRAVEILRRRFAEGEIEAADYRERLAALMSGV